LIQARSQNFTLGGTEAARVNFFSQTGWRPLF